MNSSTRFSSLPSAIRSQLTEAGFVFLEAPKTIRGGPEQAPVEMASLWAWREPGLEARCALISGPKAHIVNLMIFPWDADRVPVFASELICLGGRVHVAVIDHQFAEGTRRSDPLLGSVLAPLQSTWQGHFPPGGELPPWALHHFTPWCLFTRAASPESIPDLEAAFIDWLQTWLERWPEKARAVPEPDPAIAAYIQHHLENTPGRPFLSRVFGPDRAENYLGHFMYAALTPDLEGLAV